MMLILRGALAGAVCLCAGAGVVFGEAAVKESVSKKAAVHRPAAGQLRGAAHVHTDWCVHRAEMDIDQLLAARRGAGMRGAPIGEVEPNDAPGSGQFLNLGTGPGEDAAIDVSGTLSATDEDEFRFNLRAGDIFGVAVNRANGSPLDPIASLHDNTGFNIHENDDGNGFFSMPDDTPVPLIQTTTRESMLQFIAPVDLEFRIRIRVWNQDAGSTGDYLASFAVFRQPMESELPAAQQTIFVDFDGETINAQFHFGTGNNPANLSPLSSFLGAWGLSGGDENAVIDAILAVLDARFTEMAVHNPSFGYELLNSRDHADPFGGADVSRLIVGGTIAESGISTIGIAEWIDPGNFSRDDTAIILLDLLSTSGSGVGIQDFPRDAGFSLIEAIGRVVGNICAHEAGHYLGCWHTQNENSTPNIMDQGGGNSFITSIPGLGNDGIMGTADDNPTEFVIDEFETEGIGVGLEICDQRIGTALTTLAGAGPCDGDANGDNTVDVNDISYVLFRLGNSGTPGTVDGDANGDGIVDVNDISFVLFRLGGC